MPFFSCKTRIICAQTVHESGVIDKEGKRQADKQKIDKYTEFILKSLQ